MTSRKYAEDTEVPVDRSKAEIERLLTGFGADQFYYGVRAGMVAVGFRFEGRVYRIDLPLPTPNDPTFALTETRRVRTSIQLTTAVDQEHRSRWRALALVIKAKLVAIDRGISTIEGEFMQNTVMPDGSLLSKWVAPQIEKAYQTGQMPLELPGLVEPLQLGPGRGQA